MGGGGGGEEKVEGWLEGEESAKAMLSRRITRRERPLFLPPPLDRVPLRLGNVVEIVGPPPSSKTHLLIQAAVNCILPKEWKGVNYGGLGNLVMFFDLDCRFEILRLSQALKHRIMEANGSRANPNWEQGDADAFNCNQKKGPDIECDRELFSSCMRRFMCVRCYDSLEFLTALKTLHYQLQKERETHGVDVHFLMIDSIGAFYWIDRASTSVALKGNNRKCHSLQSVSESIIQEIRKLLLVHPMLVLATKAANLGELKRDPSKVRGRHPKRYFFSKVASQSKWSVLFIHKKQRNIPFFKEDIALKEDYIPFISACPQNDRNSQKWYSEKASDLITLGSGPQKLPYREYMPSIWQSFVTHRVLVQASGEDSKHHNSPIYLSQWLLPSLSLSDKFIVTDAGVSTL
ncbi:DNA repair protein XRCC2 homolog isoform X2 [Rhododendron vialii]|uniref:DNA repair protein XRCC2 homolog isoform X2 n=1 Tax=Rhododendron vialii TaxID=182163 RepID=UPI00265DA52C|nr:DNA repair protein XRCC2 homolog isoform X2 [Rhododendron vialii]